MRPAVLAPIVAAVLAVGCAERATPAKPPVATLQPSVFRYPWTWVDDRGAQVALSTWRGTPLVVAAIYTSCLETCPRTIVKLSRIYNEFARTGRRAEFVVVTLDPAIDTPERLRTYRQANKLPAAWHLLTGNREETDQLMDVLDVHVMDMDVHLVHDSKIVLFDAAGSRAGELDAP